MPAEHENRPDVLISGGDAAQPRRLPTWLRRTTSAVLVLVALVALGLRLAADERRREVAVQAADQVDAVVRISESGIGAGGTVVVGVQVLGQGRELRVGRPRVRPGMLRVDVMGAPVTVGADRGNQVRLRLLPRCASAPGLTALDIEVPITPASGREHVRRIPFPNGPDLVRRACGYLPVAEALTVETVSAAVVGQHLRLSLLVRNDGRYLLTIREIGGIGMEAVAPRLPVTLLPGAPPVALPLVLRVTDCGDVPEDAAAHRPLILEVADEVDEPTQVLPSFDTIADQYRTWRARSCP